MYLDHFGFYTAPFGLAPSLKFLYASQAFEETMAHLVYGLEGGEDFVLITGETGAGKTLALNNLTTHLSGAYRVALVNVTQVDFPELLKMLLAELGREIPAGADRADLILLLKQEIEAARKEGRRLLLIVDEAQNLSADTLEGLRLLVNLGPPDEQVVQVILSGQPDLLLRLRQQDLVQLRQRIRVHYHLAPLDRKEVGEYIRHRCRVAGCESDPFTDEAVALIAEHSGGVPRLVNILADKALLAAYVDGKDRVRARHVEIPDDLPRTTPEQRRIAALAAEAAEQVSPPPTAESPEAPPADHQPVAPPPSPSPTPSAVEPAAPEPPAPERPATEPLPPEPRAPEAEPTADRGEESPAAAVEAPVMARPRSRSRTGGWSLALLVLALAAAGAWWLLGRNTAAPPVPPTALPDTTLATAAGSPDSMEIAVSDSTTLMQPGGRDTATVRTAAPESSTIAPATAVPAPADTTVAAASPAQAPEVASEAGAGAAVDTTGIPASVEPGLYILVGSFRDVARARRLQRRVARIPLPSTLVRKEIRGRTWIRVLAGPWPDGAAAAEAETALRAGGIRDHLLILRIR